MVTILLGLLILTDGSDMDDGSNTGMFSVNSITELESDNHISLLITTVHSLPLEGVFGFPKVHDHRKLNRRF